MKISAVLHASLTPFNILSLVNWLSDDPVADADNDAVAGNFYHPMFNID